MANHALPTTSSLYTDVLTNLKDRIDDSLKMLDSVNTSPTNTPTNAIRWNSSTNIWEKYNGSSWVSLAATYSIATLKSINLVGGNSTTLLGSIAYQSNTDTTTLLAPNTTTTRKFLRQTGTGANGAAPVWDTILAADIPTLNQNTTGSSGSCTGNSATATTATTATNATTALNQSGGSVNATTGRFSGDVIASKSITIGTGGNYSAGSIFSNNDWGMIFRAKQPSPNAAEFMWANSADTELFRFNGTALTTNITGNAQTATILLGDETNWSTYRTRTVANMLGWKKYGNGHCIFDASNGTAPDGVAVNNTNSQSPWSQTYPTLMGWNGSQTYGVRVDSARVADYVTNGTGLGIGQTWQDVTASRVSGTTYTNSTGKPIFLAVFSTNGNFNGVLNINGISIPYTLGANTAYAMQSVQLVVPHGNTYSVTFTDTGVTHKWLELR